MKKIILFLLCVVFLPSCQKHTNEVSEPINETVNKWVYGTMLNYYYWNSEIPSKILFSDDPETFFNSLLYQKGVTDRFSWIIDNAQTNSNMLHGVNESLGFQYALALYKTDAGTEQVLGVVLYTLPNSPISQTNIKRGDVFYLIDNTVLTKDNYASLLDKKMANYAFVDQAGAKYNVDITQSEVKEDPVFLSKTINVNNSKVGYLVYNQFTADAGDNSKNYENELLQAFASFKTNNIDELVLDLRYNPGGLLDLSVLISSLTVPNVSTSKTALNLVYNDLVMKTMSDQDRVVKFVSKPNSYVGDKLKRVFVLTGSHTASASEAVINCLKAYMPVILIGETTYGKNVGSVTFTDDKKRFDWAIQPIIMKLFNANNESNYTAGFTPDVSVSELDYDLLPLGDVNETLLKEALAIITGQPVSKSARVAKEVKILDSSLDRRQNLSMKEMSIP